MEQDRFGNNNKLYIVGIVCLVLSLGLLLFSLYILPYLLWELNYNVPSFIIDLLETLQDDYLYTPSGSKWVVWLIFFIPSVITGFISYLVSNYIDNKIYGIQSKSAESGEKLTAEEIQKQIKESASLGGQILALMVLIVVVILLIQYLL